MRSLNTRQGVTAVELLMVLLLSVGLAVAMHAVVRMAASEATAARQRAFAARDLTAVWALATQELAHAASADVSAPSATALEFDRPVGEGPVCGVEPLAVLLRSDQAWLQRQPVGGRDQLLLRESAHDGAWLRRGIVSVAVANCPDLGPALRLATDAPVGTVGLLRIVEPVRLRSYLSGPAHWIGLEGRTGLASIQPLAGPFGPSDFQVARIGQLLRITVTRVPLHPLVLELPLGSPP